jgi:hypothetical protein
MLQTQDQREQDITSHNKDKVPILQCAAERLYRIIRPIEAIHLRKKDSFLDFSMDETASFAIVGFSKIDII